jgi:hypothetical protein
MGIMAGIGGAVGGLAGLFGGGSMPQAPPSFQMPNMGSAAQNAFTGIGNLTPFAQGAQGAIDPGQQTFQNLYNNPFAGQFQQGSQTAMGLGQQGALGAYGAGGGLLGAGAQLLRTGFDPQSQLYNYLQNQNLQQTQAIETGAGLATTPYGAGVEALSNQQFNMNWQNQQLQRQLAALQGAGGAYGQGAGLQGGAAAQYQQASGLPYGTYAGIGAGQNQAISSMLGNLSGGINIANLPNQDYLSYVQTGNQAQANQNQLYGDQLKAQNQQFGQQMALGSMLGGSLYNLGRSPLGQYGLSGSSPFGYNSGQNSLFGYSMNPSFGFG